MKKSIAIIALLVWPLYLNDLYLIALGNTELGILWTLDIIFFLLIPMGTLVYLVRSKCISLREIGFASPPKPISILAGLGLCALLVVLDHWTLYPMLNQIPGRLFVGYDFPTHQPLRGCLMAYAALSAGFLEEIVYRGVIISQLMKNGKSATFAVVASCVVFGGIHWGEGPGKVLSTGLWSIPLAIWFVKRKALWGPIACHTLYDLLIFTRMV
jgi:membrane protease YdiL (CAAX protease family)